MINSIPAAWKTNLGAFPPTDRIYSDFRLLEYPDLETGTPVYTLGRESNLIDRGNCESATAPGILGETGTTSNCTFARSAVQAHSGDYGYLFTKTIAAGTTAFFNLTDNADTDDMHGMIAGQTYEFEAWVKIPSGGITGTEVKLLVNDYRADSADWGTATTGFATNTYDEWQRLTLSRTLTATATGVRVRIHVTATAADTEFFYVDDILLKAHVVPGSHYLSSGYTEHLVTMPDTFTIQWRFVPTFAYDVGAVQRLGGWYLSATQHFQVYYQHTTDTFVVLWYDGGTQRSLSSAQYDDGSAERNINQMITLTFAGDLTTGDTTGSSLWLNKTQDDTAWSGNIDAPTSTLNKMTHRGTNATAGAYNMIDCRYFPSMVATDAQLQNDFKDVKNEEIYWSFDGHGTGRTRCNITRFLKTVGTSKMVENEISGSQGANKARLTLYNLAGEFSDDQYAAFDPTADQFNGTVAQKYLQRRSNITVENWYGGDFDIAFFGKLTSNLYARTSPNHKYGLVSCSADDYVAQIARAAVRKGRYYEDYDIVDTTESNSLLHVVTRLATQQQVYNYIPNSSFENADITASFTATGGTLTNPAGGFFGSKEASFVPGGGAESFYVDITFTGNFKLNVGQRWTFWLVAKSAGAVSSADDYIEIDERVSGGASNDTSQTLIVLAGGEDYVRVEVTHTITDADSNMLRFSLGAAAGETILTDAWGATIAERAPNYFVLNNNNGVAGVESADDADSASYDTIGFDTEPVAITHPWRRIDSNRSLWDYLKDLFDGTIASYGGLNSAGTFRYRSRLATGHSDPVPMGVLTSTRGVGTSIATNAINKIVVHGVHIVKNAWVNIVWVGSGSQGFQVTANGFLAEVVAIDGVWPDPDVYGFEFVARYGDNDNESTTDATTAPDIELNVGGDGMFNPNIVHGGAP